FTASAADDGKKFRAVFTNPYGTATTAAASLTVAAVQSAPTVTTQPANVSVTAGSPASFSAAASGSPTPTVQWQQAASGSSSIAGAESATYTFSAAVADSGRLFRAVFSNAGGTATSRAAAVTISGDRPFSADIDGDGKSELVVWRPDDGTWYWLTSASGYDGSATASRQWGSAVYGDVPLVGDVDGDGKKDFLVWRKSDGTWYWLTSSSGY